jgi:hypothetical protein
LQWRAVSSKTPKIGMQLATTKQKLQTSMPAELSDLCKAQDYDLFFFPFLLVSFLLQIGRSNPYHQRRFLLVVLGFKDFKGLGLRIQQCHNSINFGAAPYTKLYVLFQYSLANCTVCLWMFSVSFGFFFGAKPKATHNSQTSDSVLF